MTRHEDTFSSFKAAVILSIGLIGLYFFGVGRSLRIFVGHLFHIRSLLHGPQDDLDNMGWIYFEILAGFVYLIVVDILTRYVDRSYRFDGFTKEKLARYFCLGILIGTSVQLSVVVRVALYAQKNTMSTFCNLFWVHRLALPANFLIGLCEEFIFRSYLLTRLYRSMGTWSALIFSSLLFASLHWDPQEETVLNIFRVLFAVVLGILLGELYLLSESIWLPIGAHFMCDYLAHVLSGCIIHVSRAAYLNILPIMSVTLFSDLLSLIPFVLITIIVFALLYRKTITRGHEAISRIQRVYLPIIVFLLGPVLFVFLLVVLAFATT